ncbi:MAG TPA: cellulose binding domain-containing protein, partial [Streptosporangiaceae bacterium]
AGGSNFTGQITVTNRGPAAVTGWKLVVALPGDTVSAVQNAEFTDDNDVLFMTPAPYDLSIGPGSTATITIYASGPDPAPAECSFDNVSCQ